MKSFVLLVALMSVAHADKFPASGPCEDTDNCETACKANKPGTCYWGGVLLLQSAVDESQQPRALALFERACTKGNNADGCWQAARIVWEIESKELKTAGKRTFAAFQRACDKNHARACMQLADIAAAFEDPKNQKLATTMRVKGVKLLEQKCTKGKMVRACSWAAEIYEGGFNGLPGDAKKAGVLRDQRCVIETGKACSPVESSKPAVTQPAQPLNLHKRAESKAETKSE